ncbi:unnamed protein product [Rhizophagus irregularis]|uniref:Uncharacterized protein n=1 Tax=Rhizophagus irregularis TaxID=588596 RepID=A0A915ZE50_9GLOM|nr:unnamed protein product [Rhizophagus irregularis]CAB5372678.1 unnamed protein product [Rhizophagus irregularis]
MIFNVNENESKIHYAQKPMESFVDKCIPTNEAAAIHRQLLRALDYPGVHKLFKMLRPSYYHKEVELGIKKFAAEAKFLTLTEDEQMFLNRV